MRRFRTKLSALVLLAFTATAQAQSEWGVGEVLCAYELSRAAQILGRHCDKTRLPFDDENDEAVAIMTEYITANSSGEHPVLERHRGSEKRISFTSETERAALCSDPNNKWLLEWRATAELGLILPIARRITATPTTPTYGDCL
jgi:hypothetical protein